MVKRGDLVRDGFPMKHPSESILRGYVFIPIDQ